MKIIISNASTDPIYDQVRNQIKNHIITGELNDGDPLPSIRKLAKELQISVITTKRAYEELEKEGFIDTVGGKGCFVASQNDELLKEKKMKKTEDLLAEFNGFDQISTKRIPVDVSGLCLNQTCPNK